MNASAVGKMFTEADRAYLAGLFDGDGAIMAMLEKHAEKKFGFRVRVSAKITQKHANVLRKLRAKYGVGNIRVNRTTHEWIIRDKTHVKNILNLIAPYSLEKKRQIKIALEILDANIFAKKDLVSLARKADALSRLNVRSKNRRKNFATMI